MQQDCSPTIILGIDPGTVVMGYGLLAAGKGSPVLVEMGVLRLNTTADHAARLHRIFETVQQLIGKHRPAALAIEAPFFGKSVQSMLKLGRAQGVAMAAAMMSGLPATEYAPRAVKLAVTGSGNATKEQVRQMLEHTLRFESGQKAPMDATDALAVALCHYQELRRPVLVPAGNLKASALPAGTARRSRSKSKSKPSSSWEAFARQNPGRVR